MTINLNKKPAATQLKTFNFGPSEHKKHVQDIMKKLDGFFACKVYEGKTDLDFATGLKHETILVRLSDGLELNILTVAEFERIYKGTITKMEKMNIVKRTVDFVKSWEAAENE